MTSVDIFWGYEPDHQSERQFLAQLRADLEDRQLDALILANFYLSSGLQVNFLIVTAVRLCHIELKHYPQPLVGSENRPWKVRRADRSFKRFRARIHTHKQRVNDLRLAMSSGDSPRRRPAHRRHRTWNSIAGSIALSASFRR